MLLNQLDGLVCQLRDCNIYDVYGMRMHDHALLLPGMIIIIMIISVSDDSVSFWVQLPGEIQKELLDHNDPALGRTSKVMTLDFPSGGTIYDSLDSAQD